MFQCWTSLGLNEEIGTFIDRTVVLNQDRFVCKTSKVQFRITVNIKFRLPEKINPVLFGKAYVRKSHLLAK